MTQISNPDARPRYGIDDLAIWPDGTYATLAEVWNGDYDWMSDDYAMILSDDEAGLVALLEALGLESLLPALREELLE